MYYFEPPQRLNGNYFSNQDIYSAHNYSQYSPDQCQCVNIFIPIQQAPYFNAPYYQPPPSQISTNPYIMNPPPNQMQIQPQMQFNFGFPNYLLPLQPPPELKKSSKHKKEKTKRHDKHKSKHTKSKKSLRRKSKKPKIPPPPIKIDPYCTYSVTGETYAVQNWYHCSTCDLTGNSGICEYCARKCHAGHNVTFYKYSDSQQFYCDCPDHGNCSCMPQSEENLQCTFEITKGKYADQPMYECLECEINHICQNCAIKFHKNHEVRVSNSTSGDVCFYYRQEWR